MAIGGDDKDKGVNYNSLDLRTDAASYACSGPSSGGVACSHTVQILGGQTVDS